MPGDVSGNRKGDEKNTKRRLKKVKKEELTEKTFSHQIKNVNLNLDEGYDHVKNETANEFEQYSNLIRSKLADLEDEDDPRIAENDKVAISPDRFDPGNRLLLDGETTTKHSHSRNRTSDMAEELLIKVRREIIGDIEKMKNSIRINVRKKDLEIYELRGKLSNCENEKTSLTTKYRKYKDMAVKLSATASNQSTNKALEEENAELRNKLKNVLDELGNSEESKTDVRSKLSLKELMLKEQIRKNEDLEAKIKNFVMRFFEKMEKEPHKGAATNLSKSMDESQITTHLKNTNKSLHQEISSKFAAIGIKSKNNEKVEMSPKMKEVEVKLQNVGVGMNKSVAMDYSKLETTNKRKLSLDSDDIMMTKKRIGLSYSVLEEGQISQASSLQKLIGETQNTGSKMPRTMTEAQDDHKEIKSLSKKPSQRKTKQRFSVTNKKDLALNESFESIASSDDKIVVNKANKIVNSSVEIDIQQKRDSKQSNKAVVGKSVEDGPINSKVSSQKKERVELPAKLLGNSSISIGSPNLAFKNKVQNLPDVNLSGISLSKRSSSLSISNSVEKSKKKEIHDATSKLSSIAVTNSSNLSFSAVPTQSSKKDTKEVSNVALNLPGISLSKASNISANKSSAVVKRESREDSEAAFQRQPLSFPNLSGLSTSEKATKKLKSDDASVLTSGLSLKKIDDMLDTSLIGSQLSLTKSSVSSQEKKEKRSSSKAVMEENPSLKNLNHLSISKSEGGKDSTPRSSPKLFKNQSETNGLSGSMDSSSATEVDNSASTDVKVFQSQNSSILINSSVGTFKVDADAPIAAAKVRMGEGKMVQVASDVLKDMEDMETEEIPWEATDIQLEDSAVTDNPTFGLRDDSLNSLLSKIDDQLKEVSKKNQEDELTKKQIESVKLGLEDGKDDELEKLLID